MITPASSCCATDEHYDYPKTEMSIGGKKIYQSVDQAARRGISLSP